MGFSRQEYWSGLPLPSPGDFPNPGIEPMFPALVDSLPLSHQENVRHLHEEGKSLTPGTLVIPSTLGGEGEAEKHL